jgi:hypothetical protein
MHLFLCRTFASSEDENNIPTVLFDLLIIRNNTTSGLKGQ